MNQQPFKAIRRMLSPAAKKWLFMLITTLLCGLLSAHTLLAQETTSTLSQTEYVRALEHAYQVLQDAPTEETVRQLQSDFLELQQVTVEENQIIELSPLLGTTAESLPSAEVAQERVAFLLEHLNDRASSPSNGTVEAKLALLTTIFAQDAFVQRESLWQRFWRWLRSWLPDFPQGGNGSEAGWSSLLFNLVGYLIIAVAAIFLIYLLSLWLKNILGGFLGGVATKRRLTPDGEFISATEAKVQAETFAQGGNFREAVRRLYLAALLTLDERSLLHYDRSNTNREVLATLRNNPTLYNQLQPVVEIFDDVWYGIHEPDRAVFDRYKAAVEQLEGDVE